MKTTDFKRLVGMLTLLVLTIASVQAQQKVKIADKELVGVWLMESMQYEGEKKIECGTSYTQCKVFGANGEYACAEVAKQKDGTYVIFPHEYGTYTLKDGVYSEMGREPYKGNFEWVDKTHFKGQWKNRHDVWKKSLNMPEKLTKFIVDKCKANQAPGAEMQKLIGQYMFK